MPEIFGKTFYGNPILNWFLAFGLALISITVGRVVYWFLGTYLKKKATKTKSALDDIFIVSLQKPVSIGIILLGIRLSINILDLNDTFELWVNRIYHVLFVVNAAWLIAKITDSIFAEFLVPLSKNVDNEFDNMVIPFLRKGTKFMIWSMGFVIGLNNAGYDVGALIAGLGIGGVAIALAARNTISNVFGGITIFLDQPFKIGDKISVKSRVRGIEGKVDEVGLRLTRLITKEGTVLLIPNSIFANDPVENASMEPTRKISNLFKISKKNSVTKIELALNTLKEIAEKESEISPPIITAIPTIEDNYIGLLLIYFVHKSKDDAIIKTRINLSILSEFQNKNILWAENLGNSGFQDFD